MSRINGLRASKGVPALAVDGELTGIGTSWSRTMANEGNIRHNPSFAGNVKQEWIKAGENVGMGESVDEVFEAFVNSPSHYRNLVDPAFTHVGVGVTRTGRLYTAHQFLQVPRAAAPPPQRSVPDRSSRAAPRAPAAPAPTPAPPPPDIAVLRSALEQLVAILTGRSALIK